MRSIGRRTGRRRDTPVGVVYHDGAAHLVSRDRGPDWVRNLTADPVCEIAAADRVEPYRALAAPPEQAAAVVLKYSRAMTQPWAGRAFRVGPDADLEMIRAHLFTIAGLRLDPLQQR